MIRIIHFEFKQIVNKKEWKMAASRTPAEEIVSNYQSFKVISATLKPLDQELKTSYATFMANIAKYSLSELEATSANCLAQISQIKTIQSQLLDIEKNVNSIVPPKTPDLEKKQVTKTGDNFEKEMNEITTAAKQALIERMTKDINALLEKLNEFKQILTLRIKNCSSMIAVYTSMKSKSDAFIAAKNKAKPAGTAPAETSQQATGKAPSETKHPATGVAPGAAGKAPVATSAPATGKAPAALFTPPVTAPAPAKKAVDPIANQVGPGGKPAG